MVANGVDEAIYGIKSGMPFDFGHLIALKLYTDLNNLNAEFCKQFHSTDASAESARKLGALHSGWWHMAKLLAECVQCFGQLLVGNDTRYYRGINKAFIFSRFITRFNAPLSTSKSVCTEMRTNVYSSLI